MKSEFNRIEDGKLCVPIPEKAPPGRYIFSIEATYLGQGRITFESPALLRYEGNQCAEKVVDSLGNSILWAVAIVCFTLILRRVIGVMND